MACHFYLCDRLVTFPRCSSFPTIMGGFFCAELAKMGRKYVSAKNKVIRVLTGRFQVTSASCYRIRNNPVGCQWDRLVPVCWHILWPLYLIITVCLQMVLVTAFIASVASGPWSASQSSLFEMCSLLICSNCAIQHTRGTTFLNTSSILYNPRLLHSHQCA